MSKLIWIIMKTSILGLFIFAILTFTSCQKQNGDMSDSQLIDAIQKASKQNIDVSELPGLSISTLNKDYSDDYIEQAKLARINVKTVHAAPGRSNPQYAGLSSPNH